MELLTSVLHIHCVQWAHQWARTLGVRNDRSEQGHWVSEITQKSNLYFYHRFPLFPCSRLTASKFSGRRQWRPTGRAEEPSRGSRKEGREAGAESPGRRRSETSRGRRGHLRRDSGDKEEKEKEEEEKERTKDRAPEASGASVREDRSRSRCGREKEISPKSSKDSQSKKVSRFRDREFVVEPRGQPREPRRFNAVWIERQVDDHQQKTTRSLGSGSPRRGNGHPHHHGGWSLEPEPRTPPSTFHPVFQAEVGGKDESGDAKRGPHHLSDVGRPVIGLTLDLGAQRLKSLEMIASGCHYTVAQELEVLGKEQTSMSTTKEMQEAAKRAREAGKAKQDAARPYGAKSSSWKPDDWQKEKGGKKGNGKGKGNKGDFKKGDKKDHEGGKPKASWGGSMIVTWKERGKN